MPQFNIPTANLYTLIDAAVIAKCNPLDILHFASLGKLALLCSVEREVYLHTYDQFANEKLDRYALRPEFLELLQSYCIQIELNGQTRQSVFKEGYFKNIYGPMQKVHSTYVAKHLDLIDIYWKTYQNDIEQMLSLSLGCLYIKHEDLLKLIETVFKPSHWQSSKKAILAKNYYSIVEASQIADCQLNKVVEYAVNGEIVLMVGVPYDCDLKVYDENSKISSFPFLEEPQLLTLIPSQSASHNLQDKFQRSDFKDGYLINSLGQMKRISPFYGRPELHPGRCCWQLFQANIVKELELVPEYLFVMRADLDKLLCLNENTAHLSTSDTNNEEAFDGNLVGLFGSFEAANKNIAALDKTNETKLEKCERIFARISELKSSGVKNFNVRVAAEESLSVPRIKQLMAWFKTEKSKGKTQLPDNSPWAGLSPAKTR